MSNEDISQEVSTIIDQKLSKTSKGKMSNEDVSQQEEVSQKEDVSQKVSAIIDEKLSKTSKGSSYHIIFKVDSILRMTNEAAYEPKMVSIGPYHRGKKNLQKMEKYKLKYLQRILTRKNESSAKQYIDSLVQHEEEARSYYAEELSLSKEEFVEMMLLDGCFIVEFLRNYKNNDHGDDPIFKMKSTSEILRRDFLLFENQIPFFILVKLFDMTRIPEDGQEINLVYLAISCLNDCIIGHDTTNSSSSSSSSYHSCQSEMVIHLLSLMYESWCGSFADGDVDVQNGSNSDWKNRLEFLRIIIGKSCYGLEQQEEEDPNDIVSIKSVSELKEDGIEFAKSEISTSWLDIKFENGKIRIPPLVIQNGTESILRNLIAYEYYMFDSGYSWNVVTEYTALMDCLINTPMDAQELRVKGIIKHLLGNDEEITKMFNTIGNNVFHSSSYFMYRNIFKKVNKHCNEPYNRWISDLKKTYLKNPWKILSLVGAIILLVLTFIQTVFSIIK